MALALHAADDGFDSGAPASCLMVPTMPRIWPEMKTRSGVGAVIAATQALTGCAIERAYASR